MELPKHHKCTIYFYYWTFTDSVMASNNKRDDDPEFIFLGKKDVEADFNVSHEQAVDQIVTNLNKQKKDVQAKAQRQLKQIDEQINSLLAITHQP